MDAALRLAMLRPAASLDDIAAEACVGRATLFRHFPDRAALLRAAGLSVIERVHAALDALPSHRRKGAAARRTTVQRELRAVLEVLVESGLPLHAVFAAPALAEDRALRAACRRLDALIVPHFDAAVSVGLLRSDIDIAWLDAAFDGLLYAAWTAVREGTISAEAAPDLLLGTLLRGFGPVGRR